MEVEEATATPDEVECEAGELLEEEEEGQIVDDDEVEKEEASNEVMMAEEKENGGCEPGWSMGDEEGEIVDDDEPMEGSSVDLNHRKRRYSESEHAGSHSASPAPEDKRTAFEKFRNLSFSKKNPFADGSGRDTRTDSRSSRFRSDRDGGSRYRREDTREEEARRRDRRYDRERRDADDRLRGRGSGREANERESRRGHNSSANHPTYTPPSQSNSGYAGHVLPGSLWERIETFVQAPENQLSNLNDDDIYDKLIELLELQNEQTQFLKRREKQLDELRSSIDNEHEEIDRLKLDLPPDYFANQTNGNNDGCYADGLNNGPPTIPPDGPYANRNYQQIDGPPPNGQYPPLAPSLPSNVNGIRGYQPNVPPPSAPHIIPPVFNNPPPFDAARPPPPIVLDQIGAGNPSIPLVPDFSVPPPGFAPAPTMPLRTNSPDRFSSGSTYGNERFGRNSTETFNRDRYTAGDRFVNPTPTPLRNVVANVAPQNANSHSSNWSHSSYGEDDHSNKIQKDEGHSQSPQISSGGEPNRPMDEDHEPVSAPGSVISGVSGEYPNGGTSPSKEARKEGQPETYDVVSDDEDGAISA
ncbi:hypothetical protein QR680_002116 [Steinernema hermaphroditum]|uniref:Uncharacterized protein n=1 Tax=Steinernema hermaphroditum TaxID=289476 RepID=A0AA39LHJ2_9BILA|nr:hypothetical protein QR680_002116 [Steinernema hermaphroditum]